jgi:hypothetical protein
MIAEEEGLKKSSTFRSPGNGEALHRSPPQNSDLPAANGALLSLLAKEISDDGLSFPRIYLA